MLKRDEVKLYYKQVQSYSKTARHFGISQQAVFEYCKWSPKDKLYEKIQEYAKNGVYPDEVATRLGTTLIKLRGLARYAGYAIKNNRFILK